MTPHLFVLNPEFQIIAAYIIFIAGFVVLFSLALLCIVGGWLAYQGAIRLALFVRQSLGQEWTPESNRPIALASQAYHGKSLG